jgi:drug/metabolite transporter (DMT)-like permease
VTASQLKLLLVLLLAVGGTCVGEALLAKGLKQGTSSEGLLAQVRAVLGEAHFLTGFFLTIVSFGLYLLTLRWGDLSVVLPLTAFSYPLGAVLGKYYLAETVSPTRWLGVAIITLGVVIILADSHSSPAP